MTRPDIPKCDDGAKPLDIAIYRATILAEAADRAVAWLADSTSGIDPALAATNSGKWLLKLREKQTATLRAAIMGETK